MTTRREVPLTGDTLAWVHSELSEIKSRFAIVREAADQSRALASHAADVSNQVSTALSHFDGIGTAVEYLQNDLRSVREHLARAQDDIHSLRQSREDAERREAVEAERIHQERNEIARRFSSLDTVLESWQERLEGVEEHNRRAVEMVSQVTMRLETIDNVLTEADSTQSRTHSTLSRLDQEVQRLSSAVLALQSEDNTQRERINSNVEMLRRLEGDLDTLQIEANKISRIDDRLELVQAERTRHNEQLNEIFEQLSAVDKRLDAGDERASLTEARMSGVQEDLKNLRQQLQDEREQLASYLGGLRELEANIRKQKIVALEKEIRDIRGRAFDVAQE